MMANKSSPLLSLEFPSLRVLPDLAAALDRREMAATGVAVGVEDVVVVVLSPGVARHDVDLPLSHHVIGAGRQLIIHAFYMREAPEGARGIACVSPTRGGVKVLPQTG